jgi:hypothetical protein
MTTTFADSPPREWSASGGARLGVASEANGVGYSTTVSQRAEIVVGYLVGTRP